MTRTTPRLAPPLQTSTPHQRGGVWPLRMIWRATGPIHGGSSVESGLEPGALRFQSRDLTTRPPRPAFIIRIADVYHILEQIHRWVSCLSLRVVKTQKHRLGYG
ncbi:hypothetical protein AVEN_164697-1 [Araneus ventricosus]|uniref:Uncharacterized protein n=1 Tax=Araneus ventricosus TaxID=182803 RepID=A0A4Y2X9J8_ARAVE|nr:hypothetical protein AVEN_118830-1 [Araneus ventricosus]GBO45849.1 hypothetical protein AVEN_164697-1 [Araneus ventricosus]